MSKPFYVYRHRRATDGRVFYVGKGKGQRAYKKSSRNRHWQNIVAKHGFTVEIVKTFQSQECALSYEMALIAAYGLENLANSAIGGGNNSGWSHSDEWKHEASRMRSGKGNPNYGVCMSGDQRSKIAETLRGRPSPRRGMPSVHNIALQAEKMKALHALPKDSNPFWYSQRNKPDSMRVKLSKPVETFCGMKFYGMNAAKNWLRANGHETAGHGPISLCCNGKRENAYGYKWRFSND